jgi:Protein of unknown function (DUF3102)
MLTKTSLSAADLEQSAQRIKTLRRAATEHAVEIGRELLRIKESLSHGSFVKWVEQACEFKIRTAQDLMKLAREANSDATITTLMVPSTLRVYLSKTTPPAVRASVLKRLENGDRVSRSQLHSERASAEPKTLTTCGPGARDLGRASHDLFKSGQRPADHQGGKPRMVAELLINRLSRQDYEFVMDGMNWEVWNRILVWMKAARAVDSERVALDPPSAAGGSSLVEMAL